MIRSISRTEFDSFQPSRAPAAEQMFDEVEWFADDAGFVIGVVARDRTDHDYFVGVLGRDQSGKFRAIDVESCIANVDDARSQLLAKMEKSLATGETVFEQGD